MKLQFRIMMIGLVVGMLAVACSVVPEVLNDNGGGDNNGTNLPAGTPTVTIVSPANGAVIDTTTVNVSGTASVVGSTIAKVQLKLNSDAFGDVSGTTSWSSNGLSGLIAGTNTLTARAISSSNLSNTSSCIVIVDQTGPTANISNPADGSTNSTTVFPTINSSDDYSTVATLYVLTNSVLHSTVSSPAANENITISNLSDGLNTISVYAVDSLGNIGSTNSITIFCDAAMPSISIDAKFTGLITNITVFDITGDAFVDTFYTFSSVMLSTNNGVDYDFSDASLVGQDGFQPWTITSTLIANVTNKVKVRAISSGDKTNTTATIDIIVDTVGPTMGTLTVNPSNPSNVDTSYTFTPTITDNLSGVGYKYYTVDGGVETEFIGDDFTLNGLSGGEHTYTVYAIDNVGNPSVNTNYYTNWIITGVTVTGYLTNHFTKQWKVYAVVGYWYDSIPRYYENVATNINDSNFSINVPPDAGTMTFIAYRDDNDNSIWDSGEMRTDNNPNTNVQLSDISGIYINIPEVATYTISGWISNNIYGHSVGVAAYSSALGVIISVAPTNAVNFEYSIDMEGNQSNYFAILFYNDDNGNDKFDFSLMEGNMLLSNFNVLNLTNIINLELRAECVTGTIVGNEGVADMDMAVVYYPSPSIIFYADINKGVSETNYILPFYVNANVPVYSNQVFLFDDKNNDGYYASGEPLCGYTNYVVANGNPTNVANFDVNKYSHVIEVQSGTADAEKFTVNYTSWKTTNLSAGQSASWAYYKYGNTIATNSATYFTDNNADGYYDSWQGELGISQTSIISNQDAITNKFYLQSKVVNLTVNGTTTDDPNGGFGISGRYVGAISNNSYSLTNYFETNNDGTPIWEIFVFNGSDSIYDGYEAKIATNSVGADTIYWTNDNNTTTNFTMWYN